jgi:two-component system response regulator YesN
MPIFLEYLRGCIDWKSYGFEICAEAHDGREALEKLEDCCPDVLLADITMPYVNGLELARIAAEKYADVSTILITGNSEFEYARQAVKLGVCDYIVKPFEKEELILSLLKLRDNVNRALESRNRTEQAQALEREEALRTLLLSSDETAVARSLSGAGVSFYGGCFLVCALHLSAERVGTMEQVMNWEAILMQLIAGMLEKDVRAQICRDYESNIVLILNFQEESAMRDYKVYDLQELARIVRSQLGLECRIAVSDYCYALGEVSTGYRQTLQALSRGGADAAQPVLDYKKMAFAPQDAFYSPLAIQQLNRALAAGSAAQAEKVIEQEWQAVCRQRSEHAENSFVLSVLSVLMVDIVAHGQTAADVLGADPYERMAQLAGTEEKKNAVVGYCRLWLEGGREHAESAEHAVAQKAQQYIHAHCADADMSIPDISRALALNQTYLRRIFKEETGLTLTEYITKFRLETAQDLMRDTDATLAVIAEKTGYSDVSYFSRSFKKYFGVSPRAARGKRKGLQDAAL